MFEGLTDASLKGDPRWAQASKWTGYAGPLVLTILVLSIIEIVLGVLLIISKDSDLTFGGVVQPLLVPGLAFFNAVPSAHLHVLARANLPKLAICFSVPLSLLYLASAAVFLSANCWGSRRTNLQRNDCPNADMWATWDTNVALQLISAVCYATHAAMAIKVFKFHKKRDRQIELGTLEEAVDEEAKRRREQEARERWQRIVDL